MKTADGYSVDLICGDCGEALRSLPPSSFDLIATDPPYGTNEEGKGKRTQKGGTAVEFALSWDEELPLDWVEPSFELVKPGGAIVAFTDGKRVGDLWLEIERVGFHPLNPFYWVKTNPPSNPRKNFSSGIETAVFARKPGKVLHWNGGGASKNYFPCPIVTTNRIHPTQKPVKLFDWLVRILTDPGSSVLDPFMGSGTTGVAAIRNECHFTGIELDAEFFSLASRRLHRVSNQATIFGGMEE